jgi:hypothetical protein
MGKPLVQFTPDCIQELKKQIMIWATFPIRSKGDCVILSKKILDSGAGYISESTLYRLLLSNNKSHSFYPNTFDKLSQFVGKKDMTDFQKWFNQKKETDLMHGIITGQSNNIKSLIKVCVHTNSFNPLYLYTEQLTDLDFYNKMSLGFEFYQSLLINKNDNLEFFKRFAHLPIIRQSFFEQCIDPEFKLTGYEEGLKYYLKEVNPVKSIQGHQDYIFGNCMLFRYHFLNNNKTLAAMHGKQLYQKLELKSDELDALFIFPRMRYMNYKVWWYDLNNSAHKVEQQINDILTYCEHHIATWQENELRIAFTCMAEVLTYGNYNRTYNIKLKNIFKTFLESFSSNFINMELQDILPYTNQDGIYVYKRVALI